MTRKDQVSFNSNQFKQALKKAASSEAFRQELAERPLKALESVGIRLPKAYAKSIGDRPLDELIKRAKFERPIEPEVHPYVEVGTEPLTEPIVDVATEPVVEVAVDVAVGVAVAVGAEVKPATQEAAKRIDSVNRRLVQKKRNLEKILRKERRSAGRKGRR